MTCPCSSSLFCMRATLVAYRGSSQNSGRPIALNSRIAIVWLEAAIANHAPSAAW